MSTFVETYLVKKDLPPIEQDEWEKKMIIIMTTLTKEFGGGVAIIGVGHLGHANLYGLAYLESLDRDQVVINARLAARELQTEGGAA